MFIIKKIKIISKNELKKYDLYIIILEKKLQIWFYYILIYKKFLNFFQYNQFDLKDK